MMTKCDHCPISGDCAAMLAICRAIEHDAEKRAAFVARHPEELRWQVSEPDPDAPGGVGWVPPVGPCGGC